MVRVSRRTSLAGTVAGMVVLAGLTGCSYASHDCSGGTCGVLLNGVGAHIDIDAEHIDGPGASGAVNVELMALAPDRATLTVNGAEVTCAPEESHAVGDLQGCGRIINEDNNAMGV